MRKTTLAASPIVAAGFVAVLTLPAAAAGTTGPFAGRVTQGATNVHSYDNNPLNDPCIHLMTSYTVTLSYAPATDVVSVSAGGHTATGTAGVAAVTIPGSWCTEFSVAVKGVSVGVTGAAYAVTVTRNMPGGGGGTILDLEGSILAG